LTFGALSPYLDLVVWPDHTAEDGVKTGMGVLVSVVWIVWGMALARARVVLTDQTLTVATALRTRWFLVDQVADVWAGPRGIVFVMKDGQKVRSLVVAVDLRRRASQRPGAVRKHDLAREIQATVLASSGRRRLEGSGLILRRSGVSGTDDRLR
jgi:hypothetical protein